MKLKDTPIQRKLMSVILLTCGIVLSLMCTAYIIIEYASFRETAKSNISTLGAVIATNSSAALAFDSPEDGQEVLNALAAEEAIVAASLYDIDGNIFAKYPGDTTSSIFPEVRKTRYYWFAKGFLEGFEPVLQKDQLQGYLYIKSDLSAMYTQLGYYALIGIALITTSLLVALVLSRILQRTISEPILALKQTAKAVSEKHDYSVRAIKSGNDEVGALTDAFNQMLTQIQQQNTEILSFNQTLEQRVHERTSELQQQKDFVETIINSSVDLVCVLDKDLKFIMANKKMNDIYDSAADLDGRSLLEVIPDAIPLGMHSNLLKALGGEYVHEPRLRLPGSNKSFENYYIPLKDNRQKIYGVLAIAHDITNIVEANEKLEKVNTELMKSNRDLEQFAYVASHDLQEPLRKIQTFTQLLGDHLDDKNQMRKYQDKINQSSGRMKQLIQDMLNFSRISNSEDAFVMTDLNEILENLIIDFELLLKEKEAQINYPSLPSIEGIPLQLSQLFANIINNSLKYTERKPVIDITCKVLSEDDLKIYPKLNNESKYYQMEFRDNGIGFEQQYAEQIFAIFQRLHGKQTYSGTGIGLALCKKIVENHHGIIFAKSQPNEGATFTIILPEKQ
jgi:PAS domain S-box-containing protein